MNYYCDGERVQIYATDIFPPQDSHYLYGGRYFIRTQRMGDLGTWKELGGADGQAYVLTEQDKQDIADIVIQRLQGGD